MSNREKLNGLDLGSIIQASSFAKLYKLKGFFGFIYIQSLTIVVL
jgi:hypothetical protein